MTTMTYNFLVRTSIPNVNFDNNNYIYITIIFKLYSKIVSKQGAHCPVILGAITDGLDFASFLLKWDFVYASEAK
jgi:hypothetical protein